MSNHRYSPEFKDEAVRQIIEAGHSVSDVAARLGVSTNRGNITAEHVVLATQGYSGEETGFLQRKIFPFLAHVVATEPLPQSLLEELLPTLRAVVDTKQMFYNFRPCDKESRLILASHYLRTDDNYTQSNRILNAYRKLFPALEKIEAEY